MKILCLLVLLANSTEIFAQDHLTLYFTPSAEGIDWSTPRSMVWSTLKGKISGDKRFLGHAFVELNCGQVKELTAMTWNNFDYLGQLFSESRGLGVLFHSFEGKLEEKSELQPELTHLLKQDRANFIRFLVNKNQCARLTTYLKEYREHRVGRHFGFVHRPLFGEGASGASYGMSFIEVAGFLDQHMLDSWTNFVNIPMEFAGPPIKDEEVGLFKFLFSARKWAAENESHKKLVFWDADRIYKTIEGQISAHLPSGTTLLTLERAQGLVQDKQSWPAPEKPIWRQHTDPNISSGQVKQISR